MSSQQTNNCSELRHDLAEVKTLAEEFWGMHEVAIANGDMKPVLIRLAELEEKLNGLKNMVEPKEFQELRKTESAKLTEFFGQPIEVQKLPKEITVARMEKWTEQGFELHYLPGIKMDKEKEFPGWKAKPENWFYKRQKEGKIAADSANLKAGWVLIDGRQKPQYDGGKWMYQNDCLGPALCDLRKNGQIAKSENKDSRFNISAGELEKPEVLQALAEVLGVVADQLSLPREIEFNVIGNLHHEEWGKTNTWEWFNDIYDGDFRLFGGSSDFGGLSHVSGYSADNRRGDSGFRLMIRLSDDV